MLLSVELCSLTVQRDDASMANLVASGLFGDGAAAVVMVGERRAAALGLAGSAGGRHPQPALPGHRAGDGLGHRRQRLPDRARRQRRRSWSRSTSGDDLTAFLGDHDLKIGDIDTWVAHPGGPKVLEAMARAARPAGARCGAPGRRWPAVGNLSSSSVLHVLADTLADPPPAPGAPGVLLAMGPGFCSELVLLRW